MINLTLPGAGCNFYVKVEGGLIGPIDASGFNLKQMIPFTQPSDYFTEARGWAGENHCQHLKTNGDVEYVPMEDVVPEPTATYPDQVRFWFLYNLSRTSVLIPQGYAYTGAVSHTTLSSTLTQVAWEIEPDGAIVTRSVSRSTNPASKDLWSCVKKVYRLVKVQSSVATYEYTRYSKDPLKHPGSVTDGWWNYRSWSDIVTAVESNIGPADYSSTTTSTLYNRATVLSFNPDDAKRVVNDVISMLETEGFTLPLTHFGDLAMQAGRRLIANDTNMLAFIRDLRNPSEMIPKLKNLGSLKGLANNFLTIDYGLLPTISDLKEIMESLRRLSPHLDRFGYQTSSASYQASGDNGRSDRLYTLEQHIKLGLSDEDSGLLHVCNVLERIGLFPNVSNLWDLIPYSFVLNWFISVGDLLERVDTRLRLMRYDIKYVTRSVKTTSTAILTPRTDFPYRGSVQLVQYSRWVSDHCPVPPLSLEVQPQDSSHWLEALALIIQRRL